MIWLSGEFGLKVRGFELRFGMLNITNISVQNSVEYLPPQALAHYSVTWRFLPSNY